MKNIRLLPVVVMAIAALLVLKTLGLVTHGGYVLTGVSIAQASGDSAGGSVEGDPTLTTGSEPTLEDQSPTLTDTAPTLAPASSDAEAPAAEGGGHGAPAGEAVAEAPAVDPAVLAAAAAAAPPIIIPGENCVVSDATLTESGEVILEGATEDGGVEGEAAAEGAVVADPYEGFATSVADCLPSGDAIARSVTNTGEAVALSGESSAEQQLLERLAARRAELQQYEQDLTLRASIVDAAEKRIAERATTLEALETQISTLVDQRTEMESGQFAGIVAMYETMKPKDAATIFDNLDMDVLLRVAKTMSPRKMAPILAVMDTARAQELTVKMAALADQPATEMTPADLAALPQIVGQ